MVASLVGRLDWGVQRDRDGHRDYKVRWLIETSDTADGPAMVMACPGLPGIGATWAFGNDADPWAHCWPNMAIAPAVTRERANYWTAEQTFSTRPMQRCQDAMIEHPLFEPPRISGSFVKFTEEATIDRHGKPIRTSSHELIRGAGAEFDANRPCVQIGLNMLILPLDTFSPLIDSVNDAPIWGLHKRMVKLSNARWQRHVFGTCSFFYTVDYEFDVNYKTFDRRLMDEGHKVLIGHAPGSTSPPMDPDAPDPTNDNKPNYLNQKNFEAYKDQNGENARAILDGKGRPVTSDTDAGVIIVEKYEEANFLLLGIPTLL